MTIGDGGCSEFDPFGRGRTSEFILGDGRGHLFFILLQVSFSAPARMPATFG